MSEELREIEAMLDELGTYLEDKPIEYGVFPIYREQIVDVIVALRAENARLREALAFYAEEDNYSNQVTDNGWKIIPVRVDMGDIARKALEAE